MVMLKSVRTNTVALFFLGISSGLPILLVFGTLSVWLREAGVERATIGFLSWAALSYGFKFVWAPAVDSIKLPILSNVLGRRRSWIFLSQIIVIFALLWMASWDPQLNQTNFILLAVGAVLLGFASATQDIVIDAYRIDIAPDDQQALVAGVAIAGYRVGMLLAGAGALEISAMFSEEGMYSYHSWQTAYMCMAAFMLIGVSTTFIVKEPDVVITREPITSNLKLFIHFLLVASSFVITFISLGHFIEMIKSENTAISFLLSALQLIFSLVLAIYVGKGLCSSGLLSKNEFQDVYVSPFVDFFARYGKLALWLVLVICLYRTADIVMGVMAKVFLYGYGL